MTQSNAQGKADLRESAFCSAKPRQPLPVNPPAIGIDAANIGELPSTPPNRTSAQLTPTLLRTLDFGRNGVMEPRLGIAITTYNRRDLVISLCAAIRLFTTSPYDLVVCDDGSTDGTVEALKSIGETVIGGRNGGIARNKNRGIWYLLNSMKADIILLIDDDVLPPGLGWERDWITATNRHGHVNYLIDQYRHFVVDGEGSLDDPALTSHLSGALIGFRHDVIASVGFFDPRFGRYGNEHTELTMRAIRAGYGGFRRQADGVPLFRCFSLGVRLFGTTSHGTPEDIEHSGKIWKSVADDQIYRHAWRDDAERAKFLAETAPL